MKVELEVTNGPLKGKKFVCKEHDTFLVGRTREAHLSLPNDGFISRRHFLLEVNPPDCYLKDLESTNGTRVNGEMVTETELKDGDTIEAGYTNLCVGIKKLIRCALCGKEIEEGKPGEELLCETCQKREKELGRRPQAEITRCTHCDRLIPLERVKKGEAPICFRCAHKKAKTLLDEIRGGAAQKSKVLKGAPAIPGYEVIKCLGRGGMGAVWLAKDEREEKVAIKTILPQGSSDEYGVKELQREIKIITGLKHPRIVRFIDHGFSKERFYFILEYIEGTDAEKLLQERGGKMEVDEAIPIVLQILEALEYAHKKNLVHRDVKPHNILLAPSGKDWDAKLSDFGLAKNFQFAGLSGMTIKGQFSGSVPFMPPEQITNYRFVKPTSDVFAIGATLYHLLSGQYVFNIRSLRDPWMDIVKGKPIPIRERNPEIPQAIARVIDKAVSREATARYRDGGEMRVALEAAQK